MRLTVKLAPTGSALPVLVWLCTTIAGEHCPILMVNAEAGAVKTSLFFAASVNVFCACDCEPLAVRENFTLMSCASVTKLLSEMFPKASATTG